VVFRAGDLQVHCGDAAAAAPLEGVGASAGELVTFCQPVVSVPAVVRRDGRVLPAGGCPISCGWASWNTISATG
jgi:hypothetical protein